MKMISLKRRFKNKSHPRFSSRRWGSHHTNEVFQKFSKRGLKNQRGSGFVVRLRHHPERSRKARVSSPAEAGSTTLA